MRIVVWGINYPPEVIGIAPLNEALCEFLLEGGHNVTMLTAFPYYPAWRKETKDARKLFESENIKGVEVVRCWHYVPSRPTTLKRVVHELSFVVTSLLKLLFSPKADFLIVVSPPLLLGVAARLACQFRGGQYLIHIQDVQPDAAIRLGMIRSRRLIKILSCLEAVAYAGAWRISAISRGMLEALRKRGVPEAKLIYFPNGVQPSNGVAIGRFRELNQFSADKFLVVYSGNLGVKQGLQTLLDAAGKLKDRPIELLICGDGPNKEPLLAAANSLSNVWFKGLLDERTYREMLADADLLVVPLVAGAGNSFLPHKLLSSCAAGKPVLAICDFDSELARMVLTNRCGEVAPPENAQHLAELLDTLSKDRARLELMGIAARKFAEQFNQETVLKQFWEQVSSKQ
jgi:putative colanic acid biosynthesis glycosyltransferase WcaI